MGSENRICGQTKYTILNYSNYLNKKKIAKYNSFYIRYSFYDWSRNYYLKNRFTQM